MTHIAERRRKALRAATAGVAVLATGVVTCLAVGSAGGGHGGLADAAFARAQAGGAAPGRTMALMRAAAGEFGVPVQLLLALSYDQTRWERLGSAPSVDGGYGVMDLTARTFPADDGRGDPAHPAGRYVTFARTHDTLDEAARLLRVPEATLKTDERQNIRGAAAVLARYARGLAGGHLPASLGGWYGAVAAYSGDTAAPAARAFADDVFGTLRRGASLTTESGQALDLPASPGVKADGAQLTRLGLAAGPARKAAAPVDCPTTITCTWNPAVYAQDDPKDPGNYGDYDTAGRPGTMLTPAGQPAPMKIDYIIIHDTEGSYAGTISTFQNPASYVSANYVIRSSDGAVTEMVRPSNVSWGAGNWYVNMHAINIENEGFAAQGKTWYTNALYGSCAALVRYLAAEYHIPLDRQHILGHEDLAGPTDALTAAQHWDPGPFWNWNHFMALARGVSDSAQRGSGGSLTLGTHHVVTIDPSFAGNQPAITDCQSGSCVTLPKQPANFVYLRTGPGSKYPLLGDPLLHSGGAAGTTVDSDWGDKATTGQTFVYAGQSGSWTAIWFSGQKAWFYNPTGSQQKARYRGGAVITPNAGLASIPVYGAAYPEAAAYPSAVPVKQVVPLSYTIPAGQEYPVVSSISTDYYYAATINSSLSDDHTVIVGKTAYYQISFNHRKFFVQAHDVTLQNMS
jgi:N-acetylmuramoyl-L-alanine amidase-like protein